MWITDHAHEQSVVKVKLEGRLGKLSGSFFECPRTLRETGGKIVLQLFPTYFIRYIDHFI
jgi:hypothetical protein